MIQVKILIINTATKLGDDCRGNVVICGSHGGFYPAFLVARAGCRAIILNDAGIGMDEAGISALGYLEALGMAAVCIDSQSARIGDAQDMLMRGVVSRANKLAVNLAVRPLMTCRDAAQLLRVGELPTAKPEEYREMRQVLAGKKDQADIVLIDSASMVAPEDKGHIVITGSHGGLVGGRPQMALQVDALAAIFHDAGGGAGIARLPVLDRRAIIAATVDGNSARIGDAGSIYRHGVLSHLNNKAQQAGGEIGMRAREFVELLR